MEEETNWKKIQSKTFTKWINSKIKETGKNHTNQKKNVDLEVKDLFKDLHDGLILKKLLEILSSERNSIKINNPAVTRFQKVENIQNILNYIQGKGIKLVNIGSFDIVDGNEKLILGLCWIVILRFSIYKSIGEDVDSQSLPNMKLLRWCKAVTASYKNVNVKDFTRSWQDGLAFNAIIHKFRPDLIEYDRLVAEKKIENLEKAFTVAENELGIPRLLDPEDVADVFRPDEKSIMTYVSCFYDKFGSPRKDDKKKRIEDFIHFSNQNKQLEAEMCVNEDSLKKLMEEIENNNKRYKEMMKTVFHLYNKNMELEEEIKYKKLKLASNLGTVKSINNFYKIKNKMYQTNKLIEEKIENEIKKCDKCLRNLSNEKENLSKKINIDNDHYEKIIKILSSHENIADQMMVLEKENSMVNEEKINSIFEEKLSIFNNIIIRKDIKKVMYDALEMFKEICIPGKETIKVEEANEIFKILGINDENNNENPPIVLYTVEEFINEVNRLYDLTFDAENIKNTYSTFSDDEELSIKMNELNISNEKLLKKAQ